MMLALSVSEQGKSMVVPQHEKEQYINPDLDLKKKLMRAATSH